MPRDAIPLVASYLYVGLVVAVAETIRRRAGLETAFTRKVVHVGVGLWVIPTLLWFTDWRWAIVPPASFVVLNALSHRFRWVGSMDEEGTRNLGTILFPIAFIVLIAWFWPRGQPGVVAGGVLVLALGDAAAAVVGRRFGRHRYRIGGTERSIEGSVAMAIWSFVALVVAAWLFPPAQPVWALCVVALAATLLEAGSMWGFDNLIVPIGTAAALHVLA